MPASTTLRFHYPSGPRALTLRGSGGPLDWTTGIPLTPGPADTWSITLPLDEPLVCKPLLDDDAWAIGPNYPVTPGVTLDVYPRFHVTHGSWSLAFQWTSKVLSTTRGIYVYLPPSYGENPLARFPVVYMHDGQNLFDPKASFAGVSWQIQDAMDQGAADGSIAEAVIVGVMNDPNRISEYTPVADASMKGETPPDGDRYLEALITELKPRIDARYRTQPDAAHTFMMGSSLGGLITAYAGVRHADVYGAVGVLSPSTWWGKHWILRAVRTIPQQTTRVQRVYLDSGDVGPQHDGAAETAQLDQAYIAVGYVPGESLDYVVQNGGEHSERFWAQRAPRALGFVVGSRDARPG